MDDFFRGILIQEEGIYTLWGSKPMTMFPINYYTNEEKKALIQQMSEEEKREANLYANYDLANNWEKWEKIRSRFPTNRYLLFKRDHPDLEKHALIYFVDILKLAATLQEHYVLFQRETGMEFDPLEAAFQIEKGSEFWTEVFDKAIDNSALIGILFGYGVKNAFCFQWKWWSSSAFEKFANSIQPQFSDHQQTGQATLDRLSLPVFASFIEPDDMIEKYAKEREKIQKIYRGHNFLDLTLTKLTAN